MYRRVFNSIFFSISILIVRSFQRNHLNFFLAIQTLIQRNYSLFLFNQGWHQKNCSCKKVSHGRIVDSCSLHQCFASPKTPSATSLDFAPVSNLYFSATKSSISSIMNSVLKNNTCKVVLSGRTVDCVRCIWVPLVQIFQKNLLWMIFLDNQRHLPLLPITKGSICPIEFSVKGLPVVTTFSMVILLILFLALDLTIFQAMLFSMFHLGNYTLNSPLLEAWHLPSLPLPKIQSLWKSTDKSSRWFFPRIRNLIIRKLQKMLFFISACKVIFDPNYSLHVFDQDRNQRISAFEEY